MGILNKLFGFRWSLYIVRNENELVYAMHENSVLRIVGYCMSYFKDGAVPMVPWSLHLNFNKKHKSFPLRPEHFSPDGENVTRALIEEIESIDPEWQVPGGEPVFVEVATKRQLKIRRKIDYAKLQNEVDNWDQPKEPTFFSIMDNIFGKK